MTEIMGIAAAVSAAVFLGLMTIIQKQALQKEKRFSIRELVRNRTWLASLLVGLVGALSYMAAISTEPISAVQSITAASAIIPVVGGAIIFREKITTLRWISILLILIGIIAVLL